VTTKPYSALLAQVEALAGATLATAEQARVKIFANRRAKDAHRECPYWPRFLRVGEERVVSSTGLLPLEEPGKETIDQIIRIHRTDPWKSQAAFEYVDYYNDSTGIQITGYETNGRDGIQIEGDITPDVRGILFTAADLFNGYNVYTSDGRSDFNDIPSSGLFLSMSWSEISGAWVFQSYENGSATAGTWNSEATTDPPQDATTWQADPDTSATGTIIVTAFDSTAYVTYIAAPADTYGDGDGEESNVPEEWFEYMAQGAYCDWLRSDGQTEKALAEEAIAAKLLGQQLEKVSRQNGNQVITRQLSHGNMQYR